MPATDKLIRILSAAYLVRDTPAGGGASTLSVAHVAGGASLTVVSATNLAIGDIIRVGAGEEMELVKIANLVGAVITPAEPTVYNHAAGDPVVEQTVYDLGDVAGDGVTVTFNGSTTDVPVATRRVSYAVLSGYVSAMAAFSLPGLSLFNLIVSLGMPLSGVGGAGTTASPFQVTTDGNEFNSDANQSLIIISVLEDGTFLREELWGVDADYTGLSITLKRGDLSSVPVTFVASAGGVVSTVANPYVPNVTNRPAKGKVFEGLTEVGLFAAATTGPLATTTTAGAAAGATVLALTAVTNLVAGDWIQVGVGENVEFHQIDNIAALNANLRTKLLRAQASGVAVVRQQEIPIGGIHEDGVSIGFGGSMDAIRIATRKMQAGLRSGLATISAGFRTLQFNLANYARSLGIPQASIIAGTRLPIGSNVGTAPQTDGVYVKGITQDGGQVRVNLWGCSNDIGSIAHTLSNSGVQSLPLSFKPSSGIQFLQF